MRIFIYYERNSVRVKTLLGFEGEKECVLM